MIADIIVIAVVVIFVAIGAKTGLIRSLLSMGTYVLSIIVSVILYPIISGVLMGTPFYTYFADSINDSVVADLMQNMNEGLTGFFAIMNVDTDAAAADLSAGVAGLMIKVISFILVLVLSRIILGILIKVIDLVTKLPVIKQFNRLGGALFGGIKGILVLYIVFAISVLFVPFEDNGAVVESIEESNFARNMYEDNILLNLIEKENTVTK